MMNTQTVIEVDGRAGAGLKTYLQGLVTSNSVALDDIARALISTGGRVVRRESTFYTFEDGQGFRFRLHRAPPAPINAAPVSSGQGGAKAPSSQVKETTNETESLLYLLFILPAEGDVVGYIGNTASLNRRLISHQRDDVLPGSKNAVEIYALANAQRCEIYVAALDMCHDKRLMPFLRSSWHQHLLSLGVQIPAIKRMPKIAYVYEGQEVVSAEHAKDIQHAAISARLTVSEAIQSGLTAMDIYQRLLSHKQRLANE